MAYCLKRNGSWRCRLINEDGYGICSLVTMMSARTSKFTSSATTAVGFRPVYCGATNVAVFRLSRSIDESQYGYFPVQLRRIDRAISVKITDLNRNSI